MTPRRWRKGGGKIGEGGEKKKPERRNQRAWARNVFALGVPGGEEVVTKGKGNQGIGRVPSTARTSLFKRGVSKE